MEKALTEDQQPVDEKPQVTKGLMVEFPNGAKVTAYQLDDGSGFHWIFVNKTGIKTTVALSREATTAVAEIAYALLFPEAEAAA